MNKALRNIQKIKDILEELSQDETSREQIDFLREHAAKIDTYSDTEKHRLPLLIITLIQSDTFHAAEEKLTDMLGFQTYVITKWIIDALNDLPSEWVEEMGDRLKKDGLIFGSKRFQVDRRSEKTRQEFEDLYKHVPEELKPMVHVAIDATSLAEARSLPVRMKDHGLHCMMMLLLPESDFKREKMAAWKEMKTFGDAYSKAQDNIFTLADYLGVPAEHLAHVPKPSEPEAPAAKNDSAGTQEDEKRQKLKELYASNKITALESRILEEIFTAQAQPGTNNMRVDMTVVSIFNKSKGATLYNITERVTYETVRTLRERAPALLAMSPAAPGQK